MTDTFDGEIYLGDEPHPDVSSFSDLDDELPGVFDLLEVDSAAVGNTVFERVIFKIKDPTSLPHTKKSCAKWAKPLPGTKICVGWKIQYRWLYKVGKIKVTTVSEAEAKSALEECLKQGAIAAAIAGIASGGSAAAAAAEVVIKACLVSKLGDKLIAVSVGVGTTRGGWE